MRLPYRFIAGAAMAAAAIVGPAATAAHADAGHENVVVKFDNNHPGRVCLDVFIGEASTHTTIVNIQDLCI
jgi:hypothetical protein